MVVNTDNAVADGLARLARNVVVVTVMDETGNATVIIKVASLAKYSTQPANGLTDSSSKIIISYTSTRAGTEIYPVSINNCQVLTALTFRAYCCLQYRFSGYGNQSCK